MSETLLIEIFDVAPLNPANLEGPLPDPDLVVLEQELVRVQREFDGKVRLRWHARGTDPDAYRDFPAVATLLRERGPVVMPITAVNGRVIKTGSFPCFREIALPATVDEELAELGWR